MPVDKDLFDDKGNRVFVTLFESYLAKFVLEHPKFYQEPYIKILPIILSRLKDLETKETFKAFLGNTSLDRRLYSIFSLLNSSYSNYDSIEKLVDNFYLPAADYFLKLIADYILVPFASYNKKALPIASPAAASAQQRFFSPRSPYNPSRNSLLFTEENRGVMNASLERGLSESHTPPLPEFTKDLGIVSGTFKPITLRNYFPQEIQPAGLGYKPKEDSFVAMWLRERGCPVISGASGSTEMLCSKIFSLVELTQEEKKTIIFAQACNMIANGHHSLFETLIVAIDFGFPVDIKETLLDFYLQCLPEAMRTDSEFTAFLESEDIQSLPMRLTMSALIELPRDVLLKN